MTGPLADKAEYWLSTCCWLRHRSSVPEPSAPASERARCRPHAGNLTPPTAPPIPAAWQRVSSSSPLRWILNSFLAHCLLEFRLRRPERRYGLAVIGIGFLHVGLLLQHIAQQLRLLPVLLRHLA